MQCYSTMKSNESNSGLNSLPNSNLKHFSSLWANQIIQAQPTSTS